MWNRPAIMAGGFPYAVHMRLCPLRNRKSIIINCLRGWATRPVPFGQLPAGTLNSPALP